MADGQNMPWQKSWGTGSITPQPKIAVPGSAAPGLPWQKQWASTGGAAGIQPSQSFIAQHTPTYAVESFLPSGFDTESGVGSFWDLRDYLAADNEKEKQAFIDKGTQAGKWQGGGKIDTPIGEYWYVNKDGKKVSIVGSKNFMQYPIAGAAAHPFQSALMMATLAIPEARSDTLLEAGGQASLGYALKRLGTGTGYNMARSAFVGVASAAGAAADDATKYFRGLWHKSSDEEKGTLAAAAAAGILPEFLMRVGGSTFRTLANGYAPIMSEAERQMTMKALKRNLTPYLQQATHGHSALLPIEQSMAEYIFGFPAKERNTSAMQDLIKQKLREQGVPPKSLDQSFGRIMDAVHASVDTSEASAALREEARQRMGLNEESLVSKQGALASQLDQHLASIEDGMNSPDPELQRIAQQALIQSRRKFGEGGRQLALAADKAAADSGNLAAVNMTEGKAAAKQMSDEISRDEKGDVIFPADRVLSGVLSKIQKMPDTVSLQELHDVRSELFHLGKYRDLTPTRQQAGANRLAKFLDEQLSQEGPHGANIPVKQALDKLDEYWRSGIGKYKGVMVRQLAKDPEAIKEIDPTEVAKTVLAPGRAADAEKIKGLVGPDVWKKIADAFWAHLKNEGADPLTGRLDPAKFRKQIVAHKDVLTSAFGKSRADSIDQYSQRAAAFGGKLPIDQLTPDNFYHNLRDLEDAKAAHQDRLKNDYVKMLMDNSVDQADAIEHMMKNPQHIDAAKKFWGDGTPQWQHIKESAMTRLLAKSVGPDKTLTKMVFKPGALTDALKPYTRAQLDSLLGKSEAADLRELAQTIDFVMKKPGFGSTGSFATAYIALHPFGHIHKLLELAITGKLLASPGFVRWLTQGMKENTLATWNKLGQAMKAGAYLTMPQFAHEVMQ